MRIYSGNATFANCEIFGNTADASVRLGSTPAFHGPNGRPVLELTSCVHVCVWQDSVTPPAKPAPGPYHGPHVPGTDHVPLPCS